MSTVAWIVVMWLALQPLGLLVAAFISAGMGTLENAKQHDLVPLADSRPLAQLG